MDKKDIKINYNRSIISVTSSVLRHFNVDTTYQTLPELDELLSENYKNVVLMIIDGMGTDILKRHLSEDSFLRQHMISSISSVFPPTTTAATTAYHSGLPPISTGWLGWMNYYPQYDKIIETFLNREYYSGKQLNTPLPSDTLISYETIYSKIQKTNSEIEYYKIFPPFDENGCQSFEEECERLVSCHQKSDAKKIISVYWTEPDHSMHSLGVDSPEVHRIMRNINDTLEKNVNQMKNTIVIVSADHGMKNIKNILLNDYPDICEMFLRPPCLEARFLTFFIKKEYTDSFQKLFLKYFGNDFVLYRKREFLQSGILGEGKQHKLVEEFLGDFVVIGIGDRALHYTTGERPLKSFAADHAGFSFEEMSIPLIVIRKR